MVRPLSSLLVFLSLPSLLVACDDSATVDLPTQVTSLIASGGQLADANAALPQVRLGEPVIVTVAEAEQERLGGIEGLNDGGLPSVASLEAAPSSLQPSLRSQEALSHENEGFDYLADAQRLLKADRPGEAVQMARHALYDADSATVWQTLGTAYLNTAQTERGVAALESAVDVLDGHGDSQSRKQLIRAYLKSNDPAAARMHAEVLARRHPADAPSQYLLGLTYMKSQMWKEAMRAFDAVLKTEPTNIFARNNIGFSALQIGQGQLAVEQLERCLDLKSLKPYMLNNLGLAYEATGRNAEAWAAYSRALQLRKGYVKGQVNLARVQQHLDVTGRAFALKTLEQMAAPTPSVAVASAQVDGAMAGSNEEAAGLVQAK